MSKEKRMGTVTVRRKSGYMAKAGKRHQANTNHPHPRPAAQVTLQMKAVG